MLRARPHSFYGSVPVSAVDDIHVYRQQSQEDAARRFRRRSMHTLDSADYPKPLSPQEFKAAATTSLLKDAPLSLSASDKEAPLAGRARQEEAGVALSVATTDEVPVSTPNASSQSLESSKSSSSSRPSSVSISASPKAAFESGSPILKMSM